MDFISNRPKPAGARAPQKQPLGRSTAGNKNTNTGHGLDRSSKHNFFNKEAVRADLSKLHVRPNNNSKMQSSSISKSKSGLEYSSGYSSMSFNNTTKSSESRVSGRAPLGVRAENSNNNSNSKSSNSKSMLRNPLKRLIERKNSNKSSSNSKSNSNKKDVKNTQSTFSIYSEAHDESTAVTFDDSMEVQEREKENNAPAQGNRRRFSGCSPAKIIKIGEQDHQDYQEDRNQNSAFDNTAGIYNDSSVSCSMDISVGACAVEEETPPQQTTGFDFSLISDLYTFNLEKEAVTRPENYIQRQKEIGTDMRTILIDWLVEVTVSYNENYFSNDVIALAVNYMDRFLSKMGVPKLKLQLLGVTCLMVASKMVDTIPPDTVQMMELTDRTYSALQVRKMELMLLESLNFNLYPPTAASFFNHYLHLSKSAPDIDETARNIEYISKRTYASIFCQILSEMTLLDYRLSVCWKQSNISLGIVIIYRMILFNLLNRPSRYQKFNCEPKQYLQKIYAKEPQLLRNVKNNGLLNEDLIQLVTSEMSSSNLKDILIGVLTLWKSVLAQKRVNALTKKVDTLKEWFPHLQDVYLFYLPENGDVAEVIELIETSKNHVR